MPRPLLLTLIPATAAAVFGLGWQISGIALPEVGIVMIIIGGMLYAASAVIMVASLRKHTFLHRAFPFVHFDFNPFVGAVVWGMPASGPYNETEAIWRIPVTWDLNAAPMERVSVYWRIESVANNLAVRTPMRWESRDAMGAGVSEVNMIAGQVEMVPIAFRFLTENMKFETSLMDEQSLLFHAGKGPTRVSPNSLTEFHLELSSGKWRLVSPPFEIFVPGETEENSRFQVAYAR